MTYVRMASVLLLLPVAIAAQEVHGIVRDANSGLPIAGAVVQVVDSTGRQLSRRLSGAGGEFRVPLYGPYAAVEARRMGFRPAKVAIPAATGDVALNVRMTRLATMLAGITVNEQRSCPARTDRASAFALWEQAKAGLLASEASAEAKPADMHVLEYQRWIDAGSDRITEQHVRTTRKRAAVSFVAAATAPNFIAHGFLVSGGRERVFYAPDARVLLDDRFTRGYCFGLVSSDRSRPLQVGLSFTPAERLPNVVGVEGTLWIDTVSRRLVDMRYTYLTGERQQPASGGHLSVIDLPHGLTLIDRWSIRMVQTRAPGPTPVLGSSSTMERVGNAGTATPRHRVSESGGELARAVWPAGETFRATLGTLRARLVDRDGRVVPHMRVRLKNTDYAGSSDTSGVVRIDDLVPGPYTAELLDSTLAPIGIPITTSMRFAVDRGETYMADVETQSAQAYVARMCKEDGVLEPGSRLLIARVYRADGAAVSRARWDLGAHTGTSGADGVIVYCRGLAPDALVVLRVDVGNQSYHELPIQMDAPLKVVRVMLPPIQSP